MQLSQRQVTQYQHLLSMLGAMKGALVAFSGGVDSVFLVQSARKALCERVLAVTFVTPYTPRADIDDARSLARAMRVHHKILERPIPEAITTNPPDRCYRCKQYLFGALRGIAEEKGLEYVLDGSNKDDLDDYRPGMRAIRELGVQSPLLDAGLGKQDIRDLSRAQGLPTWNKPAGACLLTRIPHNTSVTEEELHRIDQGEYFLQGLGFPAVRLRSHGSLARIELPPESIDACLEPLIRKEIDTRLKEFGYSHVTVDLAGYRMGSLNLGAPGTDWKE